MSQYDFGNLSSPVSGQTLIETHLEPWRSSLHTGHSGLSRPSYAVVGLRWLDTTTSPVVWKQFDGTDDIPFALFDYTANTHGVIAATIGANTTQRHTIPATASDTVALLAATQTLTNKTLTSTGNATSFLKSIATPYQTISPASGFSQTINDGVNNLHLNFTGTLATGTITMPASPVDGQKVTISSRGAITALTHNGNAGQTLLNPITTTSAGFSATWQWSSGSSAWFRA